MARQLTAIIEREDEGHVSRGPEMDTAITVPETLAIHCREPYEHMNFDKYTPRRRPRAHTRQVGDRCAPRY